MSMEYFESRLWSLPRPDNLKQCCNNRANIRILQQISYICTKLLRYFMKMKFRNMRRKRQQLSEEESIGILQQATAGTLALLGDNGYPYALPISYVYDDGKLYFHSAMSGHKVDTIRNWSMALLGC